MTLYMKPTKDKILLLPCFSRRSWRTSSLGRVRSVSKCSDRDSKTIGQSVPPGQMVLRQESLLRVTDKPVKLGIYRLANGKLTVITTAQRQCADERQKLFSGRRETSLMMHAASREERSLIPYEVAEPEEPIDLDQDCKTSVEQQNLCGMEQDDLKDAITANTEHPLLFSLESNNYQTALKTIATARAAGNICNSAAAQLKEACHHLHVEKLIWATAKPCTDLEDDIIIRRTRDRNAFNQNQLCSVRSEEEKNDDPNVDIAAVGISVELLDHHSLHSCGTYSGVTEHTGSDVNCVSYVAKDSGQSASSVLHCKDNADPKMDDTQSDGPSKEQLAYMHHRLSEELPTFFEQSHDYGLYSDHIHFDNRVMKVSTRGLPAYKATIQSLKYLSTAYLTSSQMEVLRITMETEEKCIQARWRIKGVPFHSYVLRPWAKKHKYKYFDAFSTFYLGEDGLIHKHVLDKVMPSSETKVVAASWAVRLGIMLGIVRPPAFNTDIMKAITHMRALLSK